jgi:hypothetical protein
MDGLGSGLEPGPRGPRFRRLSPWPGGPLRYHDG